jgi:hypothetical protein
MCTSEGSASGFPRTLFTSAGTLAARLRAPSSVSFRFPHRGVTGKYVVSALVAGTVADGPVSDNEVGKRVARTPGVVAFVKNYFVVDLG